MGLRAETRIDSPRPAMLLRDQLEVLRIALDQHARPAALALEVERIGACLSVQRAALHEETAALQVCSSSYERT